MIAKIYLNKYKYVVYLGYNKVILLIAYDLKKYATYFWQ